MQDQKMQDLKMRDQCKDMKMKIQDQKRQDLKMKDQI